MAVIWSNVPRAPGNLTIHAANSQIAGLETMLNSVAGRINRLLEGVNAGLATLESELTVKLVPEIDLGRIGNAFAGAASQAGKAAKDAFAAAFKAETFKVADLGLPAFANAPRLHNNGMAELHADEMLASLQAMTAGSVSWRSKADRTLVSRISTCQTRQPWPPDCAIHECYYLAHNNPMPDYERTRQARPTMPLLPQEQHCVTQHDQDLLRQQHWVSRFRSVSRL